MLFYSVWWYTYLMKECTLCKTLKPLEDFRLVKKKSGRFPHSWCAVCERKYNAKRRKPGAWMSWYNGLSDERKNEYRQKQTNKDKWRKYGLTIDQITAILDAQYGACAACMSPITLDVTADVPHSQRASIDHDHTCCPGEKTCGKCVRGLLCGHCNRILGLVNDSQVTLRALAAYLKEYEH